MKGLDSTAGAKLSIYMAERADVKASGAFGWEDAGAMLRAYKTADLGRFEAIPVFETALLSADTKKSRSNSYRSCSKSLV
jgi:hypothetical protein